MSGAELTHRLAAILAADAAGYSRLMARDECATMAALDEARAVFRARVESNHGRIVDMAGDSVLAVFQTAAAAVRTALAVQDDLQDRTKEVPSEWQLPFRVGVHLGDVIEKADGTVYGDGVNIAARLQALADPGGIVVSESIRAAVRGKVDASFEDQGEQAVKNIPEPVRAFSIARGGGGATPRSISGGADLLPLDKPTIAVLPFTNMSGDPAQDYFADSITDDLITELARFRALMIVARNSTFIYKGKAVDVRIVAKELGVRYVLEGSIRKDARRVRVTGQLVDAHNGNHLWAEKYDRALDDIFAAQEELTHNIVTAVAAHIHASEIEKVRRRPPESLTAYEIAMRARAKVWEAFRKSGRALREEAVADARAALAIDPNSTLALIALAFAQCQRVARATAVDLEAAWEDGMAAAARVIDLDPSEAWGYGTRGLLQIFAPDRDRSADALQNLQRAHELNPHDTIILASLGLAEATAGNPHLAIARLEAVLRMSPRDESRYSLLQVLTQCCLAGRQYAKGVEYGTRGVDEYPASSPMHLFLAMCLVGLGEIDKAKTALEEARRCEPEFVQRIMDGKMGFKRKPENLNRINTFLRVAVGLDDPGAADAVR